VHERPFPWWPFRPSTHRHKESPNPSAPAALADDDEAISLKKKTPRWVVPAVISSAALLGLLFWAQSGPSKNTTTPADPPAAVTPVAETKPAVPTPSEKPPEPKVEVAALPTAAAQTV